ncbi:Jag N-terminal domain-containing protein [Candidatus Omnitrophota bacterium]
MDKPLEFEGKTLEEAIQKALKELNVKREEVTIKVLSEEQKGLFGMKGVKQAKISVKLKNENNA